MASHVFGFIQRARAKLSTESRTPAFTVGTARAHASRRALLELYFEDRRGAELGVVLPVQANPAGTSPPGWGWVRRRSAGSTASFDWTAASRPTGAPSWRAQWRSSSGCSPVRRSN